MRAKLFVIPLICAGLIIIPSNRASAQIEIIGDIVKEVIMAIDLHVQKLQTRTIELQDVQKQLENAMEASDLDDIIDWIQQQKDLFAQYYQELWDVKSVLSTCEKVRNIVNKQEQIVTDYKRMYGAIQRNPYLKKWEITYICQVYDGILNQSIGNIRQLTIVISSFVTQMDDADRLRNIDEVSDRVDEGYNALQRITQVSIASSMEGAKQQQDIDFIKSLYGIQ